MAHVPGVAVDRARDDAHRRESKTASALLGLFPLVTLFAHRQETPMSNALRRAAWYDKRYPTFSDAPALVRKESWARETFADHRRRTRRQEARARAWNG